MTLSFDAIVNGLVSQGVPRDLAERAARKENATITGTFDAAHQSAAVIPERRPVVSLPFTLTVPWSKLCSDNERETASLVKGSDGQMKPRKLMTARYKASKEAIRELAREQVGHAAPTDKPLAITVDVYFPPARRNDAINFSKVVHDALERVVYENDNQLHDIHWRRAGVDIDAPRAELTLEAL